MASWQVWALLSAVFAAFTAIFAKVGVAGIHPDVATLIRTIVILIGFIAQTVAALAGAIGVWWRQSWAAAAIVILGAAIAATAIVEGPVLGLIAINHAFAVAALGLAVTIAVAIYVSRSRGAAPLQLVR